MNHKIKWKVAEAPTGRYRSFQKRGWPMAYYPGEVPCAVIECEDDYASKRAKEGIHRELTLRVADHSLTPWKWKVVKKHFATLEEAKDGLKKILEDYPNFAPKEKS